MPNLNEAKAAELTITDAVQISSIGKKCNIRFTKKKNYKYYYTISSDGTIPSSGMITDSQRVSRSFYSQTKRKDKEYDINVTITVIVK